MLVHFRVLLVGCSLFNIVLSTSEPAVPDIVEFGPSDDDGAESLDEKQTSNNAGSIGNHDSAPLYAFGSMECYKKQGLAGVNETCSGVSGCAPGLQCSVDDAVCRCPKGTYIASVSVTGHTVDVPICRVLPSLGVPCTEDGRCLDGAGLTCREGVCQCAKDYQLRPTAHGVFTCFKECGSTEIVEFKDGINTCRKRCKPNEVVLDGVCKRPAKLGEKCSDSRECLAAFSACNNQGVCLCINGFSQVDGECVAQEASCPFGRLPTSSDGRQLLATRCSVSRREKPAIGVGRADPRMSSMLTPPMKAIQYEYEDTCPDGHYCQTYSIYSAAKVKQGHCCPLPDLRCPLGAPLVNASCSVTSPSCPFGSHYCYSPGSGAGIQKEGLCCPKPCAGSDLFFRDGRCYRYVDLAEGCSMDEQCSRHNGICYQGVCECPRRASATDGAMGKKVCILSCSIGEVQIATDCVRRKRLEESCRAGSDEHLCPVGARCVDGRCQCECHNSLLGDRLCGPKPMCPLPVDGPNASTTTASAPLTVFCRIASLSELIAATDEPTDAVESCPEGQYCSMYQPAFALGICCPKPVAKCLGSNVTPTACDPRTAQSCKPEELCRRYYTPADTASVDGFICCPIINDVFQQPTAIGTQTGVLPMTETTNKPAVPA